MECGQIHTGEEHTIHMLLFMTLVMGIGQIHTDEGDTIHTFLFMTIVIYGIPTFPIFLVLIPACPLFSGVEWG